MEIAQSARKTTESISTLPEISVSISNHEFRLIRDLVYKKFGINLTPEKKALVVGRLGKLLQKSGFKSFRDYYEYVSTDTSGRALDILVNHISTNFTFFFRESDHFTFFISSVLPEMAKRAKNKKHPDLRVWSAGCSSGEEPYTLVMLMVEYFGRDYARWQGGVLATDISARALETAKRGIYPEKALESLPRPMKLKYFQKLGDGEYKVADRLKREVTFRRFNLMNERFPFKKPFHVIFCRNVMIYFDQPTRDALIKRFYEYTVPGGYLFIGHSETLRRTQDYYEYVRPAIYKRK